MTAADPRNVVTQHNDNHRTGSYLHETSLTPNSVNVWHFGRLFERNVDGSPFAQILYVRNVPTGPHYVRRVSGTPQHTKKLFKNLFIVATSTNWLYAFDADNTATDPDTPAIWKQQLGPTRMLNEWEICRETWGAVGITSTPVIDVENDTIYVVACHWLSDTTVFRNCEHTLHALWLNDGTERGKVKIEAEGFKAGQQRNRPGLLLLNGVVYIGFGTFSCDDRPYGGWIFGYNAYDYGKEALTKTGKPFCTVDLADINSELGDGGCGVWQSGNGLVGSDDGYIYFETGNQCCKQPPLGTDDPCKKGPDGKPEYSKKSEKYDDSFIRLRVTPQGLEEDGYFRPSNFKVLRGGDTDLGSGGPVLLPVLSPGGQEIGGRLIGGGKQGRYYVLDADSMKPTQDKVSDPDNVVGEGFQAFINTWHWELDEKNYAQAEPYGPNIHGGPCYWPGASRIYQMPEKDYLKAFFYDVHSGTVQQNPVKSAAVKPPDGMPGGHSSLSANGDKDGIVWTCFPNGDAQYLTPPGTIVAFDAMNLEELWRDPPATHERLRISPANMEWFAKFNPPTIADGKVFRPCFAKYHEDLKDPSAPDQTKLISNGKVVVYGLKQWRLPKPPGLWEWIIGLIADSFGKIIGPGGVKPGPPPPASPIEAKWRSYGGGILAAPAGREHALGDDRGGRRRDFVGAITTTAHRFSVGDLPPGGSCHHPPTESVAVTSSIFCSPETGAHIVTGEIRDEYLARGGPTGELGYPLSDEMDAADGVGRVSYFENGYIIWTRHHGSSVRLV